MFLLKPGAPFQHLPRLAWKIISQREKACYWNLHHDDDDDDYDENDDDDDDDDDDS
jgi:hypothetical protein